MRKCAFRISFLMMMLFFTLGLACDQATAQVRFSDVGDGHWAERYIVKMDLRRVVDGYPNGTFEPDSRVKQVEAVKMAVHNAGLQADVASANKLLYLPFDVPDWARAEAIVAVRDGFIVPEEERFDAEEPAMRAWIAQLTVRMIGKEAEAVKAANDSLSFTDRGQIPAWARGHVAIAVKYGLVEGYTDGTFGPLKPVTRAEMTAFLTRAEKYLTVDGLVKGVLTRVTGTAITVDDGSGQQKEYTLVRPYHIYQKDGKIDLASLQQGNRVNLFVEGDKASYIEVLDEDIDIGPVASTVRGEIVQVYPEDNTLLVKDGGQSKFITILVDAPITLYGGTVGSLGDLSRGGVVEIKLNEQKQGTSVLVLEGSGEVGNEGIVYDIDHELKLIVIKANNQHSPYYFGEYVSVEIGDQPFATIEDIKKGDRVKIKVNNNYIEAITLLESGVELSDSGTVIQVSIDKRILTLRQESGTPKAYELDKNVKITVSGKGTYGLADIKDGDLVRVQSKQGKITEIDIKNREIDSLVKGFIVGVDPNNLVVTIKDESEKLQAFEINDIAEYYIDDRRADLEDFKKDMKVEIQLVLGKVIYLESRNTIEGTVEQISDTGKVLVFRELDGDTQTLILDSKVRVNIEDKKADIDDVKNGDFVEIRVENGKVKEIDVESELSYVIKDIVKSSNRLRVEDSSKDAKSIYIRNNVDLVIQGKDNPKIDDVKTGDIVRATYLGNRLLKVEVIPVLSGKITSVNTQSRTVVLELFEGATKNITFNDQSKIIIDGRSYYHLTDLAAGDRVQVRDNVGGGKVFNVMEKTSGQFYSVNDNRDKIFIQKNPVEWDSYNLYENVYLHHGNTSISFRSLDTNDYVTLYIFDRVVYEIEK